MPPSTPDLSPVGRASSSSSTPSSSSLLTPSRNIFRYKVDVPRHKLAAKFEDGLPGFSHIHLRDPRKLPRSPYKCWMRRHDFYLNLLDWSAHNVLAVGLGNCVYLWNASKVTKLCGLGVDNTVCSVRWAQQENHLAVGTNLRKV